MTVEVSSTFDSPLERVWAEVRRTELLRYVAAPLLRFEPIQPSVWPETWAEGKYLVRMRVFGVISIGTQWIGISDIHSSAGRRSLRDNGSGQLIRTWDHHIFLESLPGGKTRYTDRVEIRAGVLTPFVWAFASVFYRHRQRRWRKLIASGYQYQ